MAGVALLLTAVAALTWFTAQRPEDASLNQNFVQLRQLRRLGARWESGVLRVSLGADASYDPLVATLTEIDVLLTAFESVIGVQKHDRPSELANLTSALRNAVQDKAELVERFKSSHSVLRNSLGFLPTAASEAQRALAHSCDRRRQTGAASCALASAEVDRLVLASVVFSRSTTDEAAALIQTGLARLMARRRSMPAEVAEAMDMFGAHVGVVLREQRAVDGLLRQIALVPTSVSIDKVLNHLRVEQQGALSRERRDTAGLLTLAAVLTGALLVMAVRLSRSRAAVQRANRDLQAANEHLEQRVQQRTEELREAQSQLLTTARQAGMAEIASNVLHNVGNVLNSVNVSAALIVSGLRASKLQGLTRAAELLNHHADDPARFLTQDARGKALAPYLRQLAGVLDGEQRATLEELKALTRSVDHIKEIVVTQQRFARAPGLVEPVLPAELIEDALRIDEGGLRAAQVVVQRSFADVPALPLDKGRILQILVNLIGNARQAMESVAVPQRLLTLSLQHVAGGTLRIAVADQGQGIAPENMTRVFAHGYTTRADGHGFGLHSAAVAAREMGGTLSACSNGPGRGAAFTLELPVTAEKELA